MDILRVEIVSCRYLKVISNCLKVHEDFKKVSWKHFTLSACLDEGRVQCKLKIVIFRRANTVKRGIQGNISYFANLLRISPQHLWYETYIPWTDWNWQSNNAWWSIDICWALLHKRSILLVSFHWTGRDERPADFENWLLYGIIELNILWEILSKHPT